MGIQKAIASGLTSVVSLVALFAPEVTQHITNEQIVAASLLLSPALVWLIPNK